MPRRRALVHRAAIGLGLAALVAGTAAALPGGAAGAAPAPGPAGQAPAMTGLPHALTFTLAPKLAAALGRDTIDAEQARELLAGRGALPGVGAAALPAAQTPEVGTVSQWPALDITTNTGDPVVGIYLKEYTLRAKGPNIEAWVASGSDEVSTGTQFPAGDCRASESDPTVITDAQLQSLVSEFENSILPLTSEVFSVAPPADGTLSAGQLAPLGITWRGSGTSTVTLIDNVRDENFYDFENNRSYVAGFFTPVFNILTNRNVMTIDAYDWLHRTGENPPDDPSEDVCQSRPARPRAYESIFAHEYQHLLQNYHDQNETLWVNEGLSEMAPTLVGYADPTLTVHQTGGQADIFCYQGYGEVAGPPNPNPVPCGGPENSLTLWEDQGSGSEVLTDYGIAWSFMIYLHDRYGPEVLKALHTDGQRQSLASVQAFLDGRDGADVMDLLHDFQLSTLLDNTVSDRDVALTGVPRAAVTTEGLEANADADYVGAFASPGAAPNGADYVRLRDGAGAALAGDALKSVQFTGAEVVPSGADGLPPELDPGPPVENWFVRLVGISEGEKVLVRTFDDAFDIDLDDAALAPFAGYDTVLAVVSHDDRREAVGAYAPYTLTVNGVVQPGGS